MNSVLATPIFIFNKYSVGKPFHRKRSIAGPKVGAVERLSLLYGKLFTGKTALTSTFKNFYC